MHHSDNSAEAAAPHPVPCDRRCEACYPCSRDAACKNCKPCAQCKVPSCVSPLHTYCMLCDACKQTNDIAFYGLCRYCKEKPAVSLHHRLCDYCLQIICDRAGVKFDWDTKRFVAPDEEKRFLETNGACDVCHRRGAFVARQNFFNEPHLCRGCMYKHQCDQNASAHAESMARLDPDKRAMIKEANARVMAAGDWTCEQLNSLCRYF